MTTLTSSAPFAYISHKREICTVEPDGRKIDHALGSTGLLWGDWDVAGTVTQAFSWPTWSPDGKRVACFRLPNQQGQTGAVYLLDADGVGATELANLGERLPIYLFWSPNGEVLAVLTQEGEGLHLSSLHPGQLGREERLAAGSPLFFTWAGSSRIAAYCGHRGGPRLDLFDPYGNGPHAVLPGTPGSFCAPLAVGDRVVYVDVSGGSSDVVAARPGDAEVTVLERHAGLVALLPSADGRYIGRAVASRGDGTPYRHLGVIDLQSGEVRNVSDEPCLAFLWLPDGSGFAVARVDTTRNLIEWTRVGLDGEHTPLCALYPTRDLGFYLRFFEQYSQSHPIVDPLGESLMLAGNLLDRGDPDGPARLWQVALDGSGVDDRGEGVFAVYGPVR